MFDYNYYPLINKLTRITIDKCSSMDHILTNVIGAQINSAILAHEIADHLPIIQVSSIGTPLLKTENREWCFSELNLKRFYGMVKTKDFKEVYDMSNPDDSFKKFLREINPLLVSCFKRKKDKEKIFNVVYGTIVNYYFSRAKRTDSIKLISKRKLQSPKINIINLEIIIST